MLIGAPPCPLCATSALRDSRDAMDSDSPSQARGPSPPCLKPRNATPTAWTTLRRRHADAGGGRGGGDDGDDGDVYRQQKEVGLSADLGDFHI